MTLKKTHSLSVHWYFVRMAEEPAQGRRRNKKKELDHDQITFGYWYAYIMKKPFSYCLYGCIVFREEDLLDEGEYRASSTFMPHPFCTVSGGGKTYMIYEYVHCAAVYER